MKVLLRILFGLAGTAMISLGGVFLVHAYAVGGFMVWASMVGYTVASVWVGVKLIQFGVTV